MPSEPLLPPNGRQLSRVPSTRDRLRRIFEVFIARAPTNGARVTESLDYEPIQNDLYFQRLKQRKGTRHVYGYSGLTLAKNLVVIITGLCTGLVSVVITKSVGKLLRWRNDTMAQMLAENPGQFKMPFLFNAVYGLGLTSIGALMVTFWAPTAAGAGVTLVMAYLNGNHIPNLLRWKTLVTKIVGAIAGVASGLAIGPEGPMVHIGACIASNVTYANCAAMRLLWPWAACSRRNRGSSEALGNSEDDSIPENEAETHGGTFCATWEELHEDSEHREFISAGASAGLSAAFGAPIGGVLFSMEEACSFWSRKVAWRCFLAAILAAFMMSQLSEHGDAGVIIFHSVRTLSNTEWLWQLPLMVAIAVLGGLLGAVFNIMRRALWRVRASRSRKFLRVAEALAVSLISVCLAFYAPTYFRTCVDVPSSWEQSGFEPVRWSCPEGTHNDLATAFHAVPDDILGCMFSIGADYSGRTTSGEMDPGFTIRSLLLFGSHYLVMMALGSGVCVPAGLFMPSISLGASWGLAAGLYIREALPHWHIQPGLYALICATAVLAGVFRSAISLTTLVVEGTRGINFLFGIIIAVVVSNFTASVLEHEGVYESEIERDGNVFFLRHEPPRQLATLTAGDIMVPRPICFPPLVALVDALRILQRTTHHGFPVVSAAREVAANGDLLDGVGQLEGIVLRSQLLVLLRERAFCDAHGKPLIAANATREAQNRIEHAMRMFYRNSYTHHRYAATRDPGIGALDQALARSTESSRRAPASPFASAEYGEISYLPTELVADTGGCGRSGAAAVVDVALTDERVDAEVAELAEVLASVGSPERLYVDLRPYMNPAPLAVRKVMSAARVHRTFVTLGMRHLCVVNARNRVVGIITRKDLDRAAVHGASPGTPIGGMSQSPSVIASTSGAGQAPRNSLFYMRGVPETTVVAEAALPPETEAAIGVDGGSEAARSGDGGFDGHAQVRRGLRKGEKRLSVRVATSETDGQAGGSEDVRGGHGGAVSGDVAREASGADADINEDL